MLQQDGSDSKQPKHADLHVQEKQRKGCARARGTFEANMQIKKEGYITMSIR